MEESKQRGDIQPQLAPRVEGAAVTDGRLEVLLLCDYQADIAATVRDHIQALECHSRHRFWRLSMLGEIPTSLELGRFDALVIHYSLTACDDRYLSAEARKRIASFRGLKAIFVQDEYRFVNATVAAMREMGINLVFTCVPSEEIEKVYPGEILPGVAKVNVLTGYVPERLVARPVPSTQTRKTDIGYRGRKVPAWLGRLGQEKWTIGERVARHAAAHRLVTDISFREEDRLYGDDWINFVSSCKAMLGVESGASVFDFTGEIQRQVDDHVRRQPNVDFETLHNLYFAEAEGKITLAQISPRSFECAALRTLMILYEGQYSGILVPWRHYVPLKKDHSNFLEVIRVLRDPAQVAAITERAHAEIALDPRYSFRHMVARVDDCLDRVMCHEMRATASSYASADFRRLTTFNLTTLKRRAVRRAVMGGYRFLFKYALGWARPAHRDRVQRRLRQVIYFLGAYTNRLRNR